MKVSPLDMVRYHEGQIASRSLSVKLGLNQGMTLYAVATGESISQETSDQTKLIQVLDGRLQVTYDDGESDELKRGDIVSFAAGQGHALAATENTKFWQLLLD